MSNHVDKGKQPLHPYQSVWMSYWSALEEQNQLSNFLRHHGNDHGTNQWHLQKSNEITSDISGSVKQRMEINDIDFGILNRDQAMSSENQRKDRLELLEFSIINRSQESQHTSNVEHVSLLLSLSPPGTESSYMDSHSQHKIFGSSLGFLAPLPKDFSGTSSCVSPRIFDLEEGRCETGSNPTAPSFLCRVEENDKHVRSILSSKRKLSDTNIIEVKEHEKCSDCSGFLSENLSMRNNHPPAFREEQYKKMNNFSSINMFSTCAHEANTMRMYTSAEDLGGFTPRYQVNHTFSDMENTDTNLWKKDENFRDSRVLTHVQENVPDKCYSSVMENTDTNLWKKDENFRDSRVLTCVQENVPNKCYSFPQLVGHGKQEVQILVLSSDSEGNDDVIDVSATQVVSKNASAGNHTMDMNINKEKLVSGVQSSSLNKNVSANTDSPHPDISIGTPGEKVQSHKRPVPAVPDMNIQLHAEPGGASVVDNADPSTSQTRSLDVDYVPDQSNRWLKSLKISDPCTHSVGTKSLRLDEATTNKKANQIVSKGIGGESSNSEPVAASTGNEPMIVNQKETPLRAAVSSSNDNVDGSDVTKRLHTWIQRWRKPPTATPKNRSEPVVICDPQTCEVSLEELEKKPLSSIAAMALLGKGWSDVKCHYQNKGTYTVWES